MSGAPATLSQFVRDALAAGQSRDAIRTALVAAKWRPAEVDAALADWAESDFPLPVPRRRPQLSAREAFLYLLMFATLYVATYNAGAVLFACIERAFPDAVHTARFAAEGQLAGLRWVVAALVIALPVFLYTHRLIARGMAREPDARASGVRRWLTYLTLFIAALVLIGDFVAVLRGFLAGELVPRFLLKAAVVGLIAGVVFRHYLADLKRDEVDGARTRTAWLGRAGVAGLALVAVAGLWLVGTPGRARVREADIVRLRHLQELSLAIENFRALERRLPDSPGELGGQPGIAGARALRDPATGVPYEYTRLDSTRYALCATFAHADSLGPDAVVAEFWRHPAGRHCFEFHAAALR